MTNEVQTFFTYRQGLDYVVLEVTFPADWKQPKAGTWFKSLEGFMVPWHGFYSTPEEAQDAANRAKVGHLITALACRMRSDEVGARMVQELHELIEDRTLKPLLDTKRAQITR